MMYDQAIRRLVPNAEYMITGNEIIWENKQGQWVSDNFVWLLRGTPKPTKEQIETSLAAVHAEWNNTEYQRLRQKEYPPLEELADALYWQANGDGSKMQDYMTKIASIKNKYPKGSK